MDRARAILRSVAAFSVAAPVPCHGQAVRWQRDSELHFEHGPRRGRALLSDIDGDGIRDLASNWERLEGNVESTQLAFLSGADLHLLAAFDTDARTDPLRIFTLANVGDLDGDGLDDLGVGAPVDQDGRVDVVSARSGAVLLSLRGSDPLGRFGDAIVAIGDVDGDAIPDFAVGSPAAVSGATSRGRITAHSGADGAVLLDWTVTDPSTSTGYARTVTSVADRDGDRVRDLLAQVSASAESGQLRLISSASGIELARWILRDQSQLFTEIGDVNGDGVRDLIIGFVPWVEIWSGADGSLISFFGAYTFPVLTSIGEVGDIDGDGCPECFVCGSDYDDSLGVFFEFVEVRSCCTDAHLFLQEDYSSGGLPDAIASDDADADGLPDLLVSGIGTDDVDPDGLLLFSVNDDTQIAELNWQAVFDSFSGGATFFDDLDGDGHSELLVHRASAGNGDEPRPIVALSSRDGAIVQA